MGWLGLVGSLKVHVSFAEYSLFCRSFCAKETYNTNIFTHTHPHTHPHTHTNTLTHTHIHTHSHANTQTDKRTHNYTHTHTQTHITSPSMWETYHQRKCRARSEVRAWIWPTHMCIAYVLHQYVTNREFDLLICVLHMYCISS